MKPERLNEIRARLAAAIELAPPPWHYGHKSETFDVIDVEAADLHHIGTVNYGPLSSFVVHAPSDIAELVQEVERQREEINVMNGPLLQQHINSLEGKLAKCKEALKKCFSIPQPSCLDSARETLAQIEGERKNERNILR